jgi:hypothetical protein
MMTFLVVRRDVFLRKNSAHKSSSAKPRDASATVDTALAVKLEKQLREWHGEPELLTGADDEIKKSNGSRRQERRICRKT